ncbi:MAG TPA: AAA family ATPase, partial [Planctomycetaceae bacterium]
MYESFYGLRRRPFAAAPDAEVTVETPAVADAVERLDRCVRHGRGVGVLTAAAGMGKTHLCHRLARLWDGRFRTAILPNAGFPTRRGLLQAILAELDEPYQRLGETELRLELTAVAKAARSDSGGIVLLLDEAHRYSERLLDEVRLVANLVEGGEPLVRVVLAGQVELEDKLSDPSLAGLNERVGELVTLPRLTAEESRHYLRERASHAGSRLEDLFDPEAAELIVQACGGTPRCLNQLADHALLLGYVAERRPVGVGLVREALDDLKRLPLQWHDPLPSAVAPGDQAREPE